MREALRAHRAARYYNTPLLIPLSILPSLPIIISTLITSSSPSLIHLSLLSLIMMQMDALSMLSESVRELLISFLDASNTMALSTVNKDWYSYILLLLSLSSILLSYSLTTYPTSHLLPTSYSNTRKQFTTQGGPCERIWHAKSDRYLMLLPSNHSCSSFFLSFVLSFISISMSTLAFIPS